MDVPKNGSIVIIDDQIKEAIPLMNALAKKGASYLYYDGKSKNYPDEPLDNVRLIFLDMHLDEVASGTTNTKNIVSSLVAGISTLVQEKNGPYVILVWSKHDSQHLTELKDTLLNKNSLPCKPIAVLNLEKSLCFETIDLGKEAMKTEWVLRKDGFDILENNLKKQLAEVDSFLVLCNWENGINYAAKETVYSIGKLFGDEDLRRNDNLKLCLARMARAYAGHNLEMSNRNIIQNAYYSMNTIANDFNGVQVDKIVKRIEGEVDFSQSISIEGIDGDIIISMEYNKKEYILAYKDKIYFLYEDRKVLYQKKELNKLLKLANDKNDEIKNKLSVIYWDNISSINALLNIRNYILDSKRPGNIYESSLELKKELCTAHKFDEEVSKNIKGIELEVSPICDYVQDKRMRLRIVPGLEIPAELIEKDDSKYTYITIPIMLDGKVRRLLFDFRYYTSEKIEYLDGKKPIYAIGDELLQNIKEQMSTHGMRSGFVYVE